jgi:two-component system sensor histidine kinase UhpB
MSANGHERAPGAPPARLATALGVASVLLGVLLLGMQVNSPLGWLPGGVTAGAMLRWGWRGAGWVLLGAALAGLAVGRPLPVLGFGLAGAAAAALALGAAARVLGVDREFARRDGFARLATATTLAMAAPGGVALLGALAQGYAPAIAEPGYYFVRWWLSASIASLAVVPGLVAAGRDTLPAWRREWRTTLALLAATAGWVALLAARLPDSGWVALLAVPLTAFAALRMDLAFASLLVLVLTTAMAMLGAAAAPGTGPGVEDTLRLWTFCLVLTAVNLTLRALLAERDALRRRRRLAEASHRVGLLDAAVREQERIGRDVREAVHRDLEQLGARLATLRARVAQEAPELLEDARQMADTCGRAIEASLALSEGFSPGIEGDGDLAAALRRLAQRIPPNTGVEIRVDAPPRLPVPAGLGRDVYRIAQEALANALKHARARRIAIELRSEGTAGLRLEVRDDGRGFDLAAAGAGLGLRTMQYRAEVIGASIHFESRAAGGGTQVILALPLPATSRAV